MPNNDIHIKYQTVIQEPRTGFYGSLTRTIAKHPLLSGAAAGLLVVAYAAIRSTKGVLNEPTIAAILGLIVIAVWTTLFFVMRSFFERQSFQTTDLDREIILTDTEFIWKQSGQTLQIIHQPTIKILADTVPPALLTDRMGRDTPTPVWLIIHGDDGEFVLKTRITAQEASRYPTVADALTLTVAEELSVNFASPLLMIVREQNDTP